MSDDAAVFEPLRPSLLGLAYGLLGELAAAEDVVQEAWIRWAGRKVEVDAPRAYLSRVVTRLALNQRTCARHRHETYPGTKLPDPVETQATVEASLQRGESISMALMVVLQRLTAAERAAFILHQVFDFSHAEVATMLGKRPEACRQLLHRARAAVATSKRSLSTSHAEHTRLLRAFYQAVEGQDLASLTSLLHDDVVLAVDAGPRGARFGKVRNLPRPVRGARRVAAFLLAALQQRPSGLRTEERLLNGAPALLVLDGVQPYAAFTLGVVPGHIDAVYLHADPSRLAHLTRARPG